MARKGPFFIWEKLTGKQREFMVAYQMSDNGVQRSTTTANVRQKEGGKEMTNVASIDLGYGWTKAISETSSWKQPSVVGSPRPLFDDILKGADVRYISQDGNYFIGDLALRQSEIQYTTTKDDKSQTWTSEVLFKTALACLAMEEGPVNLVTGLPVDYYFTQKEPFEAMLNKIGRTTEYTIRIGSSQEIKQKSLEINQIKIVPQPLGAAMDYLLDNAGALVQKEEAGKKILVIDWGHFTLDLLVLDAMEISKESCSPAGLGVDKAYRLLGQLLRETIKKAPPRHEMEQYIRSGTYEGHDIRTQITSAYQQIARQIALEVDSLNMAFDRVLLVGGAAHLLGEHLNIPNLVILPDAQMANVRGYQKIGARLWL